jgi:Leu/Phe-tRNA-protein transferase
LTTTNEIDSLTEQAISAIIETAKDIVGQKIPNEKPWITDEIIAIYEDKQTCFCNKSDCHSWDTYKLLKRRVE